MLSELTLCHRRPCNLLEIDAYTSSQRVLVPSWALIGSLWWLAQSRLRETSDINRTQSRRRYFKNHKKRLFDWDHSHLDSRYCRGFDLKFTWFYKLSPRIRSSSAFLSDRQARKSICFAAHKNIIFSDFV